MMARRTPLGFLEIRSPEQLFKTLERVFDRYQSERGKRLEDVFLLVFGLAPLREWIAPGYKGQTKPKTDAERFSEELYRLRAYDVIRCFANQTKHQEYRKNLPMAQSVHYGLIDDAPDFDAMLSVDDGPPIAYSIGGYDAAAIFNKVLKFYREKWFSLPFETRYS